MSQSGNSRSRNRRNRRKRTKQLNQSKNKTNKTCDKKAKNKSRTNSIPVTAEQYCNKFKKWGAKYLHNALICGYIRPSMREINDSQQSNTTNSSPRQQLTVYGYTHSIFKNCTCPKEVSAIVLKYYDENVYIPYNIIQICSLHLLSFVKWPRFTHLGLGDFLEDVTEWQQNFEKEEGRAEWIHINLSSIFHTFLSIEKRIFVRKYMSEKWPWPLIKGGYFNVTLNGLVSNDETQRSLFKDNIEHLEYVLFKKSNVKIVSLSNLRLSDESVMYLCHLFENISIHRRTKKKTETNLEIIDLSHNSISDKYMSLLLRMIKRNIPSLKELNLAFNNRITNKSLSLVMKYAIDGLQINMTGCKGITVKSLNKYQRGSYNDGNWIRYLYCKNMIYFGNKNEPQSTIKTKMKMDHATIYHPQWH